MTMTGAILLLICLILIGLSIRSFQNGLRRAQTERVLSRLAEGQPQLTEEANQWSGVERMFLRAGLGKPTDSLGLWLAIWALGVALGLLVAGWLGLLVMLVLPPVLLRLYIAWRYQR
ncbi:type II secretion system protein F, partial [Pseudomonas edaphica]|nr:type II secretion system protein F [Pseudomonas edaphica]